MWRRGRGGLEVVLVHRSRYDDWSFPKGKVDAGETDEEAAIREVQEETSLLCRLGPELSSTSYTDRTGRPKVVRYWAMTPCSAPLAPAHEIDRAEWVPVSSARQRLSYGRDEVVLDDIESLLEAVTALDVEALDHVVLNVADTERSLAWYCGLLGLQGVRVREWRAGEVPFASVRVDAGTIIDLLESGPSPAAGGGRRGIGGQANMDHLCLVVAPTRLGAVASSGVFEVVDGPVRRFGARGDGTSLYVRDPDGNLVELRHY